MQSKEERTAWRRNYYLKNAEKIKARSRERYKKKSKEIRASHKARREADPDWRVSRHLKHLYGITLEQRNAMLSEQQGCGICGTKEPTSKRKWHVDHCHKTGAVRGVLCQLCNTMLGMSRDNPAFLLAAVDYLRKHSNGEGSDFK